jgi:hypothetical protein
VYSLLLHNPNNSVTKAVKTVQEDGSNGKLPRLTLATSEVLVSVVLVTVRDPLLSKTPPRYFSFTPIICKGWGVMM